MLRFLLHTMQWLECEVKGSCFLEVVLLKFHPLKLPFHGNMDQLLCIVSKRVSASEFIKLSDPFETLDSAHWIAVLVLLPLLVVVVDSSDESSESNTVNSSDSYELRSSNWSTFPSFFSPRLVTLSTNVLGKSSWKSLSFNKLNETCKMHY